MELEEADFELPMNLFEEEENKFDEGSDFSEKEQVELEIIEEIGFEDLVQRSEEDEPVEKDFVEKDFVNFGKPLEPIVEKNFKELRKEKANELGRMKIDLDLCNQEKSLEIRMKNVENSGKDLDSIEEDFKKKRKEKANELSRMKMVHEFSNQANILEIKTNDYKSYEKDLEQINVKNFRESEDVIASPAFEFKNVSKLSKLSKRKFTLLKEKKIRKKSIKKNENFERILKVISPKQLEEYSFSEKYSVLKRINSKMKLIKVSDLNKINAKIPIGNDFHRFGKGTHQNKKV
uniref:Uncharacterized protein n=1 Tax=Meloidogyne incognita TaxID=6306 RepID=A0A914MRH9_MELIC